LIAVKTSEREDQSNSSDPKPQEVEPTSTKARGKSVASRSTRRPKVQHSADTNAEFLEQPLSIDPEQDTRSPLERFRSPPKKALSVTDIISPAWCELQYWYSLTRYGRVRQTPAMKQGTKIHKKKEREVYTEVPVEVASAEDKFGLRLWNMIVGLRTLRTTGLTRELGVFGIIEGEVIIGIIDELTRTCPDEEAGASIRGVAEGLNNTAQSSDRKAKSHLSKGIVNQPTMAEFFANRAQDGSTNHDQSRAGFGSLPDDRTSIYLVDIKTRKAKSLPRATDMRPTRMQLMLYHRLLADLARGEVDPDHLFDRYKLDKDSVFSDTFIASLNNLDSGAGYDQSYDDDGDPPVDAVTELLAHNTLVKLWSLMVSEVAKTFPDGTLSPMLTAEYRASTSGEVIGKHSFALHTGELNDYVASEMQWWRGERPARGVEVAEASRCGICEFADNCSWRKAKLAQATTSAKSKRAAKPSADESIA
jgi:exonuclease V